MSDPQREALHARMNTLLSEIDRLRTRVVLLEAELSDLDVPATPAGVMPPLDLKRLRPS